MAQFPEVIVLVGLHDMACFLSAEGIHDHIVSDAHTPCRELSRWFIESVLQFHDDLDKGLLEDIICQALVVDNKKDVGKQLVLIARQQDVESLIIALHVFNGQLFVGHSLELFHFLMLLIK